MLTLAVESSNPSSWTPGDTWHPGVCIGESDAERGHGRVLGVEPINIERPHDDDLMPAIDRLMRGLGLAPAQLGRIAISAGPGGFTAIRTAIAAGQMIAEAVGARAVVVPTALVVAARAPRDIPTPFAVTLSSKGRSTHLTTFRAVPSRSHRLTDSPSQLITAPDLPALQLGALIADRFLPDNIRAAAAALNIPITAPVFDPVACFELSFSLEEVDPQRLLPIYPREPEAVTKWRALHGPRTA